MHRTAILSLLAALLVGLPVADALAGERCCRGRRTHAYARPVGPYEAWLYYYRAQAEVSFARRAASADYYAATGRALPSRYLAPPTNTYAEQYSLDPYAYFSCPQARRGEGVCPDPDFFKP